MNAWRWTICDPGNPEIIDKGLILKKDIMDTFLQYPWQQELKRTNDLGEDAQYSPSVEFTNEETGQVVTFSLVGDEMQQEFYIFYQRKKTISILFGLFRQQRNKYVSDITGQTMENAIAFLEAFLRGDNEEMEIRIKG
ncbi:MAG: hypothetical protein NTW29_05300 [Bacteroidetes bacterium]|nr:hypothetical protein [Bacteroidota bacterium]